MKKAILLILLVFILSISFVSASENITEIESNDEITVSGDVDVGKTFYVNSTKQVSGDGSSWENASNTISRYSNTISFEDNSIVYLAEGEYKIPGDCHKSVIYIGSGENTIITSFLFTESYHFNTNHTVTVINATFKPDLCSREFYPFGGDFEIVSYNLLLDEMDYKFINCIFINSTFLTRTYERENSNMDTLTDIITADFENCTFKDYTGNYLINNWECSKFIFNKCRFENISCDAIIDSYGGKSDSCGRFDGVYIYNSYFTNNKLNAIVKARQLGYCEIVGCSYDFDTSEEVSLTSPFYVNKTRNVVLNETELTITVKNNSVVVTLTDVNANRPISGVEVGIINNDKLYDYKETDCKGQIILNDLEGTYNFEFLYNGDPYSYLPASINKTFTFVKNEVKKEDTSKTTTVKVVKKATKITAKAKTFKVKKTKKYSITLKSGKKALSKVKVTIKVGKKTYSARTNTKGKATFNLKKLTKKGKYTAVIKFSGNKYYKATTKKVKITVKK